MGNLTVLALRAVLAMVLAGTLFVQVVMAPLLWADLDEVPAGVRVPVVVIVILGIVTMQVTAVCVWRLLTMVRRGTVFSHAAFRYVDIVIVSAKRTTLRPCSSVSETIAVFDTAVSAGSITRVTAKTAL